ncbi:MAG: hypothetical protein KTR22_03905 [Flavobacteriaceae bacterium]|nr:hypothetical protein [Flavobacteriaceae bacterium]
MLPSITKANYLPILKVLSAVLLVLCIGAKLFFEDDTLYRWTRVIICFSFLIFMYFYGKRHVNPLLALFLFFYGTSGIAILWYEKPLFATLSMFLNFVAYFMFIRALLPKVSFKKMNFYFAAVSIVLILVNVYMLYAFIDMIGEFTLSDSHQIFMMLFAMSFIATGFLTLLYNHTYSTKNSFVFTVAIYCIIFSEVLSAMGYYDFGMGDVVVYLSRALLIAGSAILVYYALLKKNAKEELGRRLF